MYRDYNWYITYEKDLLLNDFSELIKVPVSEIERALDNHEATIFWFDGPWFDEPLDKSRIDVLKNPIITFDLASLILMSLWYPNCRKINNIILRRWNNVTTKKIEDINIWESIKLDWRLETYSFIKKFNKNLKCIAWDNTSKIFQTIWPFLFFKVDDFADLFYYKRHYYLNNENNLIILDVHPWLYHSHRDGHLDKYPKLDVWFDINSYAESFEKTKILIWHLKARKDEYKNCPYPIDDIISSIKNFPDKVFKSEELCECCWRNLYQFWFCSPRETRVNMCWRKWDMRICPHCRNFYKVPWGSWIVS